jgi:23S rRNA pseudouridine955/2504/2580 synthase
MTPDDGSRAKTVQIDSDHSGQRVDNYLLTQLKGVSRSHVYKLLRSGQVRVNSGRKKPHYKLQCGDAVRIPPVRMALRHHPAIPDSVIERLEASVLFENENLLVMNKPSGIAVHGGSGIAFGIIEAMKASRSDQFLELVHRLDRETSGCLLLAKNRTTLTCLHDLLRTETNSNLGKYYTALVAGHWHGNTRIDKPLVKVKRGGENIVEIASDDPGNNPTKNSQSAVSHFESEQIFEHATLMKIRIETGRTHQIRVHASGQNHPVAGDEKYGNAEFNRSMKKLGLKRLFLHAARLEIPALPATDAKPIIIEAPLEEDLKQVLNKLKL